MILENTIIENKKSCFMGKMILDDLRKRLERLDEDADLMIDNNDRYQMVIVGGSAFILLGKLTRATFHTSPGGDGPLLGANSPYSGCNAPDLLFLYTSIR